MRPNVIGIIFKKQLIELLRDKRTVFVIFILPIILYPLMIVGFTQLSVFMIGKIEEEVYKIVIQNADKDTTLVRYIEADSQFVIKQSDDPLGELDEGKIQIVVTIPEKFRTNILNGISDSLRIQFDGADEHSEAARSRIRRIISDYKEEIVEQRIADAGLDKNITRPIVDDYINIASEKKMGGFIFGRIVALILVLMAITGTYYTSVDMVAGEKERGTLETLLVSPVNRMEIVVGKYITVLVLGLLNAILNLASLGLTMGLGMKMMGGGLFDMIEFSITPWNLVIILLEIIPLAALFGAIFLALSSYAKSYKEAQGYLTPVFLIAELPAMAALLPGFELTTANSIIPVLNVALLFKKILIGPVAFHLIILTWVSTAIYAILALKWASKILSDEETLLSESDKSPLNRIFSRKKSNVNNLKAGFSDSIGLFAICVALLWWIGAPLQAKDIIGGLLVTEIILVALPAYLLAKRLKYNIKTTFRLNKPKITSTLIIIPLAIAGFILIMQLQHIFSATLEIPQEYLSQFQLILDDIYSLGFLGGLAIIALLPAVCEEFLFRGYILDGLKRKIGPFYAIIITGILFGAFHLDPYRLVPASILGIFFGFLVWRSESIFIGMLAHFINNALSFSLNSFYEKYTVIEKFSEQLAPLWVIAIVMIVFVVLLWLFIKTTNGKLSARVENYD